MRVRKNDTIVFASTSRGSNYTLFDLERAISKIDLRSCQVKVRSRSDHDPSRSICTSSEAGRRAKSFGTICASISPSCCEFLAKTDCDLVWPHLTFDNLPVSPDRQFQPYHHGWGEWSWCWKKWVVSVGLYETGSIFIFPLGPIIGVTKLTWP